MGQVKKAQEYLDRVKVVNTMEELERLRGLERQVKYKDNWGNLEISESGEYNHTYTDTEELEKISTPITPEMLTDGVISTSGFTNVFITDWRLSTLKKYGLDPDTIKKKYPSIVYCIVTPWGLKGDENKRGTLGAYWHSTFGVILGEGKGNADPAPYPEQFGDIVISNHIFGGTAAALYQQQRTGGGS